MYSNSMTTPNRYANCGRKVGSATRHVLKWKVTYYDFLNETCVQGKFPSIRVLNEKWDLKLTGEHVKKITTNYRVDMDRKMGDNSFLSKFGHLQIERINERVAK